MNNEILETMEAMTKAIEDLRKRVEMLERGKVDNDNARRQREVAFGRPPGPRSQWEAITGVKII